jgi:hypothetical protein
MPAFDPTTLDDIGALPEAPAKRGDIWFSTMSGERDIIKQVVNSFEPVLLEFPSIDMAKRRRMRFYRCKRSLMAQGNRYVETISFVLDGERLTVQLAEDLTQYVVRKS